MRDRTRCIYCHAVGFVRSHRGGDDRRPFREFSCGQCAATWRVTEPEPHARPEHAHDKPAHKRR